MDLKLTKAEEKAMKILWKLEKGAIRDVLNKYKDPKPAYTTVATIFKILEKKGFVGRTAIANTHEYFPLIQRVEYTTGFMRLFVKNYFSNSFKNMVSEFSSSDELTTEEMEELIHHFQEQIEIKNKK